MLKYFYYLPFLALGLLFPACEWTNAEILPEVQQGTVFEIQLTASSNYTHPYTDVDVWATFTNESGTVLKRPAFWSGNQNWMIRFSPPDSNGLWAWESHSSLPSDTGLNGQSGKLKSTPYRGDNNLLRHGLLAMSPGKRNVVHKDGTPFLVVGDTPWAIPFRATLDQVKQYASDRQSKGFNAALLMSLQPDIRAEGPEARNQPQGFMRAFEDLSDGHINRLKPTYFEYLDSLVEVLLAHEIVPVFQPVFHGFGWKGLDVLGNVIEPAEYVRYCKYLLARYGSQPAFWLIAGDNGGRDPGVKESGEMLEAWDCYQQPTGLHYNPSDDYTAEWAANNPLKHAMHFNKTFQAEDWLDFQWAQTGHGTEHLYHKVERMYDNLPTKAVANGEPTYEGMNDGKNGLGWWQGEDAWMQLMSGGTMGVVYGAASLWQWKVTADEEGWTAWATQAKSWDQALQMEGSTYVGLVSRPFVGVDFADMEKRPDLVVGDQPLLAKEGEFYLSYLHEGGSIDIKGIPADLNQQWYNPKTGAFSDKEKVGSNMNFEAPGKAPWVLVIKP